MKKNIFCRLLLGVLMMISLLLTACNSGSTSNSQLTQVDSVAAKSGFALNSANSVLMSLNWTIDGQALSDMSNLKDFGWHVLTLSVASIPSGESVPVQGIQWDIQGATAANTPGTEGSQVVIQDLNCQNAVFRNAGDSCSVYFRFNYNYAQYNNVPLSLSVEFAPGNFSQISYYQTIQTTLTPLEPIADIRPISRLETNYWQASQLQQAPNDYQIIQVQNGSPLAAVSLSSISAPTNPNYFSLVNRSSAESSDPYYGNYPQCATVANGGLNQVSSLSGVNQNCLLIYKAVTSTYNNSTQSDLITIGTNADLEFPWDAGNEQLTATYQSNYVPSISPMTINGSQMAVISGAAHASGTAMVVDANGTYLDSGGLTAEANFNQINVVNSIKPALALSPTYEYGTEIYAPWTGNPIAVGTQLIEALNNGQVQLNSVASTDGSIQLGSNSASYPSDSHSSSISVSVSSNNLSSYGLNGQVYISMQNFYNGISTSVNGNVNLYSNGTQTLDTTSNSSSTWHNNLSGRYNSSCDGTTCTMVFTSFGQFFNLGCANNDQGACGTGDNGTVTISFPQNYASSYALTLAQGLPYPTAYIGLGGQDFGVAIGSASGSYAPAISVADAPADGIFTFNGSYQNGQSSSSTSFAIGGLNQGDVVYSTTLNFTPSTAYALSSFNITQVSKSS